MKTAAHGGTTATIKTTEAPAAGPSREWEQRLEEESWWQSHQDREALVERLLGLFTDPSAGLTRDKTRRRGLTKLLDWLQHQPGDTWQERWLASGADAAGFDWTDLPLKGRAPTRRHHRDELCTGLVLLVAGQVIRPGYRWLLRQRLTVILAKARTAFDPESFRSLELQAQHATAWARSDALNKITWMVIRKGGLVSDITVGDCLKLTAALARTSFPGQCGPAVVLRPAQGHRCSPGQRTVAVAGTADRGPPQRRAARGQIRHRVQARTGSAGGVLHRTGSGTGPHLAALHRPQPVPAVLA